MQLTIQCPITHSGRWTMLQPANRIDPLLLCQILAFLDGEKKEIELFLQQCEEDRKKLAIKRDLRDNKYRLCEEKGSHFVFLFCRCWLLMNTEDEITELDMTIALQQKRLQEIEEVLAESAAGNLERSQCLLIEIVAQKHNFSTAEDANPGWCKLCPPERIDYCVAIAAIDEHHRRMRRALTFQRPLA